MAEYNIIHASRNCRNHSAPFTQPGSMKHTRPMIDSTFEQPQKATSTSTHAKRGLEHYICKCFLEVS